MPQALDPSSALLSPVPPTGNSLDVAGEDNVRFQRGPRSYRVRGLARCLSAESLKVALRVYFRLMSSRVTRIKRP